MRAAAPANETKAELEAREKAHRSSLLQVQLDTFNDAVKFLGQHRTRVDCEAAGDCAVLAQLAGFEIKDVKQVLSHIPLGFSCVILEHEPIKLHLGRSRLRALTHARP